MICSYFVWISCLNSLPQWHLVNHMTVSVPMKFTLEESLYCSIIVYILFANCLFYCYGKLSIYIWQLIKHLTNIIQAYEHISCRAYPIIHMKISHLKCHLTDWEMNKMPVILPMAFKNFLWMEDTVFISNLTDISPQDSTHEDTLANRSEYSHPTNKTYYTQPN